MCEFLHLFGHSLTHEAVSYFIIVMFHCHNLLGKAVSYFIIVMFYGQSWRHNRREFDGTIDALSKLMCHVNCSTQSNVTSQGGCKRKIRWLLKMLLRNITSRGGCERRTRWLLEISLRNVTSQGGCERRIINANKLMQHKVLQFNHFLTLSKGYYCIDFLIEVIQYCYRWLQIIVTVRRILLCMVLYD